MEAIILAGGLGTRLKSVVDDVPKPMAPINDKPFLTLILDKLNAINIERVVLAVGYKHEMIVSHFGDRYKSLELVYSVEDSPMGTGGALVMALTRTSEANVLVMNGDSIFDLDLERLLAVHEEYRGQVTMALKLMESSSRYGSVQLNETGRIVCFEKQGEDARSLINSGVYVVNRGIFENAAALESFSVEQFFQENCEKLDMVGEVFNGQFIDIGIPESYLHAQEMFP